MDDKTRALVVRLQEDPANEAALKELREHLDAAGMHAMLAKVLEWWAGTSSDGPSASEALLTAGEALLRGARGYDRPIALFMKAIERSPDEERAHAALIQALEKVGRGNEYGSLLEKQLEGIKGAPAAQVAGLWARLAKVRRSSGKLDEGIEAFENAVRGRPQDVALAYDLAEALLQRSSGATSGVVRERDVDRAADLLTQVARRVGGQEGTAYAGAALDHAPTHLKAVEALVDLGGVTHAIPRLEAYLESSPQGAGAARVRWLLSSGYKESQRFREALRCLQPLAGRGDTKVDREVESLRAQVPRGINPGDKVGNCEIVARLRTGGMATLYLGRRDGVQGFARNVAVKVVHPHLADEAEFVAMFVDEAKICSRIHHPNVVQVEAFGEHDDSHYMIMEFVNGCSLQQLMGELKERGRRLSPAMAVYIMVRVLDGLHAAHEATGAGGEPLHVVHRDVSPSNVLLAYRGPIKLIDFGVAKASGRTQQTGAGQIKGKFQYMAPEQAQGAAVDRRADVYSAGLLLWEMLTQRRYNEALSPQASLSRAQSPSLVAASTYAPNIDPRLDEVISRALAPDVDERHQTSREFRKSLAAVCPEALGIDDQDISEFVVSVMEAQVQADLAMLPSSVTGIFGRKKGEIRTEFEAERSLDSHTSQLESVLSGESAGTPNFGDQADSKSPELLGMLEEAAEEDEEASLEFELPEGLDESDLLEESEISDRISEDFPRFEDPTLVEEASNTDLRDSIENARRSASGPPDIDAEPRPSSTMPSPLSDQVALVGSVPSPKPPEVVDIVLPARTLQDGQALAGFSEELDDSVRMVNVATEELLRPSAGGPGNPEGRPVAQVVAMWGGGKSGFEEGGPKEVIGHALVHGASKEYRPLDGTFTLQMRGDQAALTLSAGVRARVMAPTSPGEELPPSTRQLQLGVGEAVELDSFGTLYRVRVVRAHAEPKETKRETKPKVYFGALGASLAVHVLFILSVVLLTDVFGVNFAVEERTQEELFAEGVIERPERPPPRERPPAPRPRRQQADQNNRPQPDRRVRLPQTLQKVLQRVDRERSSASQADRLLSALTSPNAGEGRSLSEVVTNLDAVAGGGQAGAVRFGGTLGALAGVSGVNVASGGGGDLGTIGGSRAVGMAGQLQAQGTGPVRGRVRAVAGLSRVSGSLSRGEVQAVINRYIGRIRRCYEQALTRSPGLSGSARFAWTITPAGGVSGVRSQGGNMTDGQVSNCISGVIRRMRFPRPQGGSVQIVYPFMFQRSQ